jgi:hypothetical protein
MDDHLRAQAREHIDKPRRHDGAVSVRGFDLARKADKPRQFPQIDGVVTRLDMLDQLRRGHIISEPGRFSGRVGRCEFADQRIDIERPFGRGIDEV